MGFEGINLNSYKYPSILNASTKVNNTNNIALLPSNSNYNLTNQLQADTVSYTSNSAKNTNVATQLRAELEKTKEQQGLIGKAWDGIKNLFGMKAGSSNVEKTIKKLENGEITQDNAKEALTKYKDGQKMCVDVVGDMVSGIMAVGCAMASPFTGGASLLLAAGIGAGAKVIIKGSDYAVGCRGYGIKDFGYDLITGSINGAMAPLTNAWGGAAGTGVAKICGLNVSKTVVKEAGEEAVEAGVKQAGKGLLTRLLAKQGTEYVAEEGAKAGFKTIMAKTAAYGVDMAVDGALGGATDGFARSLADGDFENMGQNMADGFTGGLIAAPIIGGGFRLAGNAGSKIGSRLFGKAAANTVMDNASDLATGLSGTAAASGLIIVSRELSESTADSLSDCATREISDGVADAIADSTSDIVIKETSEHVADGVTDVISDNTVKQISEGTTEAILDATDDYAIRKVSKAVEETIIDTELTEHEQRLINYSKLLSSDEIKYSTDEYGFDALKLSDTLNKELSAQDKKCVYNLIKTLELLEGNADIESFPIIVGDDQIRLLELYIKQNSKSNIDNELLQQVIERNKHYTKLSDANAQLIYDTPLDTQKALSSANGYLRVYDIERSQDEIEQYARELMRQGYSVNDAVNEACRNSRKIPAIDLSQIADGDDVSRFGFPVGTKKEDLRFYVYMIEDSGALRTNILSANLDRVLQDMDSNNKIWSKSLLSQGYQNTFMDRHYGFITEPKIGNMYSTRIDGSYSGYDKTKTSVLKNIFDGGNEYETKALTRLPDKIREQLGISEAGYEELVKKLKQTGNIFDKNTPEFIEVEGKRIEFAKVKEAISNAQDELFSTVSTYNNSENNEILDEMLNIKALFIKSTDGYEPSYQKLSDNNKYIADFIERFKAKTGKELPIIIL